MCVHYTSTQGSSKLRLQSAMDGFSVSTATRNSVLVNRLNYENARVLYKVTSDTSVVLYAMRFVHTLSNDTTTPLECVQEQSWMSASPRHAYR